MTDRPTSSNKQLKVLETEQSTCSNCHAPLEGPYCGQCGQEVNSTLKYFWSVILHILDDIFSFDSRAKRTLIPLLLKPGFLTQEYFDGKRVLYVPPLRLYLFISIVFFLSLSFFTGLDKPDFGAPTTEVIVASLQEKITNLENSIVPENIEEAKLHTAKIEQLTKYLSNINMIKNKPLKLSAVNLAYLALKQQASIEHLNDTELQYIKKTELTLKNYYELQSKENKNHITIGNKDGSGLTLSLLSEESNLALNQQIKLLEAKANEAFNTDPSKLIQQVISKLPQLMFVLLPLFALLLKIMFIFNNRLYMEHLTVALHSHSFIFLIILIVEALDKAQEYSIAITPMLSDVFNTAASLILIWLPIYLFLMQKRVYHQRFLMAYFKYMIISSLYLILIFFTALIAFVWGLSNL